MPRGVKKQVSIEDLDGIILENELSYSLFKLGKQHTVAYVGLKKMIEEMDIEEHNNEYIEKLKKQLEEYDKDGYNFLGFNEEGIHRNGTKFSETGMNAKGWIGWSTSNGEYFKPINGFTATYRDLEGYDREGFDIEGYTREGIDIKGRDRDGFYVDSKFNDAGIHKETGTEYAPDGFNVKGYNIDGFDREGKNKQGKTIEELGEQKNQQRRNYLGLMNLAKGYASGDITIEEYLKNHKITLEELINFAKKQSMDKDTILGLYRKKREYNQYKTKFNKADYFKNKTTINGIEVTSEMVDKVLEYLKANDRYLSLKVVSEHIRAFVNGDLIIEEKQEEDVEKEQVEKPYIDDTGVIHRPEETKDKENTDNQEIVSNPSEIEKARAKRDELKAQMEELERKMKEAKDLMESYDKLLGEDKSNDTKNENPDFKD